MSIKDGIIWGIENNDPAILNELAEIILAFREKVNYKEIKFTDKELKKAKKYMEEKGGN